MKQKIIITEDIIEAFLDKIVFQYKYTDAAEKLGIGLHFLEDIDLQSLMEKVIDKEVFDVPYDYYKGILTKEEAVKIIMSDETILEAI
ncbi:hypothetical protein HNQ94_002877 [Salirhabdus euzebyi]|uniref:Uncharacterized protein n=1 Tax=Salirhabdus euzebyi TaxID=394506 RepID=A0A841Q7N8_9BACI|nr:hypothetical protein [Salirhabdus euzebyi]MBB6454395.1 hypothetical protein [Salirhabdus euzebyi]